MFWHCAFLGLAARQAIGLTIFGTRGNEHVAHVPCGTFHGHRKAVHDCADFRHCVVGHIPGSGTHSSMGLVLAGKTRIYLARHRLPEVAVQLQDHLHKGLLLGGMQQG